MDSMLRAAQKTAKGQGRIFVVFGAREGNPKGAMGYLTSIIKGSTLQFRLHKFIVSKRSGCWKDRSACLRPDLFDALERDGVCAVPGYFSADKVARILDELGGAIQAGVEGRYQGPAHAHLWRAHMRLNWADLVSPTSREFFEDPMIVNMALAYVSPNVKTYQRMVEKRFGHHIAEHQDSWHFDDWITRFKAFLYLTDVGPGNAPFTYLKGSHKPGAWRLHKELEYHHYNMTRAHGFYFPWEVDHLRERFGFEEAVFTAPAGTLILTDTKGIHRGTTLREGSRIMLANYFDVKQRTAPTAVPAMRLAGPEASRAVRAGAAA